MTASAPSVRIEEGWQRLADGLHIQRYFLHVHPRRRTEAIARGEALGADDRYRTFPGAALLLGPPAAMPRIAAGDYAIRRAPWPVVLLHDDGATSARLDEATRLITAAELTWCAELAGNVVVHAPALADAMRSAPREDADGWLPINLDGAPDRIAAQWISAAAAQLWRWFARDRVVPATRSYVSPTSGADLDAADVAGALFVEAFLERLRLGIERTGQAASGPPWPAPAMFESAAEVIDQLLGDLDDLVLQDLLQTNLPYPRRFQKYWAGGGAGQSE